MVSDAPRILIVDDDPQIHRLLSRMLTPKYRIASAFSAKEAFELLTVYRPAMVTLDLMMPQTSGLEVCHFIRTQPELNSIRILILSAKDAQTDRLDGLAHGADDYIAKPFHMSHLVRKIGHMLAVEPGATSQ